jgi:molecular chaperone GrpE
VVDEAELVRIELQQAQAQSAELKEHVLAISAEFENFRRRQQEEQKRQKVLMKEDLFRDLLPLIDNLDRSLVAARQNPSVEALLKGVELIRKGFDRLLENNEISQIQATGVDFDPALHEAMMVEERDDVPDQSIVLELQTGYKMGDRVLRPSMVKVARNPQASAT